MNGKIQTDSILSLEEKRKQTFLSLMNEQKQKRSSAAPCKTEVIDIYSLDQTENQNSSTQNTNDSTDNMSGLAVDFGEEFVQNSGERAVTQFVAQWAYSGKVVHDNFNISLTGAERISSIASRTLRVLPVISLAVPPAWESFKYTVLENEGPEGIINHKYEISMAAVGGVASTVAMGAVLASNPAGWAILGTFGLCMIGSIALENFGAYLDSNPDFLPFDG